MSDLSYTKAALMHRAGISVAQISRALNIGYDQAVKEITLYEYEAETVHLNWDSIASEFAAMKSNGIKRIQEKYKLSLPALVFILSSRNETTQFISKEGNTYSLPDDIISELYTEYQLSYTKIGTLFGLRSGQPIKNRLSAMDIEPNKQKAIEINDLFFQKIDTPKKAYWLGFLYADGNVEKKRPRVSLSLMSSDINHLEKLKSDLNYQGTIKSYRYDRGILVDDKCVLQFTSRQIKSDLIKHGCYPVKSNTLKPPTAASLMDDLFPDFIRGLVDGDGSIAKPESGQPRIRLYGTWDLLNWVTEKAPVQPYGSGPRAKSDTLFELEWKSQRAVDIMTWLYKDASIYLERKMDLARNYLEEHDRE